MSEAQLKYPLNAPEHGSFRLLELPPELCALIESSVDSTLRYCACNPRPHCPSANPVELISSLSIKGGPDEDAVLCTSDKTYTIRSVVLSNSVLVVTPSADLATGPNNDMPRIEVQESLSEILELAPTVPKLHRLRGLLRGMQWEEGHEDEDEEVGYDEFDRPVSIVWRSS